MDVEEQLMANVIAIPPLLLPWFDSTQYATKYQL